MFPLDLTASPYETIKSALEHLLFSVQQLCDEIDWSEAFKSSEQHVSELLPENFVGLFISLVIIVLVGRFVVATVKGTLTLLVTVVKTCLIAYMLAIALYLVNKMTG
ncbi:hypothetical protein FBULB1_2175 [Fusarium bulbicola]|nr:hypothetical protein FBULB1_2175 [Fusarium bulbicola]